MHATFRKLAAPSIVLSLATAANAQAETRPAPDTLQRALEFTRLYEANAPQITLDPARARNVDAFVNAGRGNVPVYLPGTTAPTEPTPLIVLLHGFRNNGDEIDAYFQFSPFVDSYNFILITPTGRSNFLGQEYWNATDACCDIFGNDPDDSTYLRALVSEMQQQYNIDPRRIHFAGHSNGGFMSYRMACDHADIVASIASLAGATWANPNNCTPAEPVHTLQIHGTSDDVIFYNGGNVLLSSFQPGGPVTTQTWAGYNNCSTIITPGPGPFDLTTDIAGPDANPDEYVTTCDDGGSARLWTIPGGEHSPNLTTEYTTRVLDFLFAHPKPELTPPCPADTNADTTIDVNDLLTVLANFATTTANGPADGDVNLDNTVDVNDLLVVLNLFGTACP